MNFLHNFFNDIYEKIDKTIYNDFARREKNVGHLIFGFGLVIASFTALASINYITLNSGKFLSSIGNIAISSVCVLILVILMFCLGVMCCYAIIVIFRWAFNFHDEYNHFMFSRKNRQERLGWERVSQGRCYRCGIKSLYTRKDGSKRCSKCGWDSRNQD